jgi:hypothetical protein
MQGTDDVIVLAILDSTYPEKVALTSFDRTLDQDNLKKI